MRGGRTDSDRPISGTRGRRSLIAALAATAAAAATGWAPASAAATGRPPALARVILDNDFSGDPDGLFQLAHHVLCRTLDIALVIGSHLPTRFSSGHDAQDAAARAHELLELMGLGAQHAPLAGAEAAIPSRSSWQASAASRAIVREALRDDTPHALVYAAGAGLTDLALAWLAEPRIGRRLRLVWIGGHTHRGMGPPLADRKSPEFNFMIDPLAAQIVFNESDIEIWQVPSDTYRQMLFPEAELDELAESGPLGAYLKARVEAMKRMLATLPGIPPIAATEACVLGDSPLVTLTALLPPFNPDPSSSRYRLLPTPHLQADGSYRRRPGARPMRVYTDIDAQLTFRDMLAKFRRLQAGRASGPEKR